MGSLLKTLTCSAAWALSLTAGVGAQSTSPESAVIAGLVFNFSKFTQWPDTALPDKAPITLCLAGAQQELTDFVMAEGRVAQGHPFQLSYPVRPEELKTCSILYIAKSERARLPDWLQAVQGRSVLTVSNVEDFIDRGGMIGLVSRRDRMQFSINLVLVRHAKLALNSQLSQLAVRVVNEEGR